MKARSVLKALAAVALLLALLGSAAAVSILYLGRHGARVRAFVQPGAQTPVAILFSSPDADTLTAAFENLKTQLCYAPDAEQGGVIPCLAAMDFRNIPIQGDEYRDRTQGIRFLPRLPAVYFVDANGAMKEFYPAGLEYLGPEKDMGDLKKLKTIKEMPRENRLLAPANRLLMSTSTYHHVIRNLPALMVGLPGIGLLLAFLAGITVSFSPCALPMYPALVGYIAGDHASRGRGLVLSLLFVVGLSITLTGFGIAFALILRSGGHVIWGWFSSRWMYLALFLILGTLSLHLVGLITINFPSPVKMAPQTSGYMGALFGGVLFGFVTNSCGAPITVALVMFASSSLSIFMAGAILFVYGLGQGFLLILIGVFTARMRSFVSGAGRWSQYVNYFSGGVLLLVAVYFFSIFLSGH